MKELPEGWVRTSVGDLGEYWNGRGFKKAEWRDSGRPIVRIQNLTGSGSDFNYFQGDVDDQHVARPGDLLVSWAATLGVYVWDGPEAVVNQHIFKVESRINGKFHRYLLDYVLQDLQAKTHGSGMVHITRGRFEETPVEIPTSADEQQRIVDLIEEQFSRLDAGVESLRRAQRNLSGLRGSILGAAFEGLPTAPLSRHLKEPLRNGKSAKKAIGGNVRIFTLSAVTKGDFSEQNTKLVNLDPAQVRDLWAMPGDIFIERSNTPELVGTAAMYGGVPEYAIFPDLLIRLRFGEEVIPRFAELALQSKLLRRYFRSKARGISGSMPKIDQRTIEEAPLPAAKIVDQRRIVAEVERQFSIIDEMARTINAGIDRSLGLRRSILSRAFSGRLV